MLLWVGLVAIFSTLIFSNDMVDSYEWLEDIQGERALAWVKDQNTFSASLKNDERFSSLQKEAFDILTAQDKIPYGALRNGYIYNFWRDAKNPKGVLRRIALEDYRKHGTSWEHILDIDELSKNEKENWVYQTMTFLPNSTKTLVYLSRDGKDSHVIREFDLETKKFISDGFIVGEGKSDVSWLDEDTVLVASGNDTSSVTVAGYPRLLKVWKRGTTFEKGPIIAEADKNDMSISSFIFFRPEGREAFIIQSFNFYEHKIWYYADTLIEVPLPSTAQIVELFKKNIVVRLRDQWNLANGKSFKAGSLLAFPVSSLFNNTVFETIECLYEPRSRTRLDEVVVTSEALYLKLLDNVHGSICAMTYDGSSWRTVDFWQESKSNLSIVSAHSFEPDIFIVSENFLVPSQLYYCASLTAEKETIYSLSPRFDATRLVAEQREAVSKDGTKIPYWVLRSKDAQFDGTNPTILYGYGGFEVALEPSYISLIGKLWLEKGGVFVLANIRGGGEFGPEWHQAAIREKRQNAFDDFRAVAEDLIETKITSSQKLACMGGSNGGLLVGVALTQYPHLFKAVICQVPLLDMMRYHKLLAGASWIAEYGDPEDPAMREVLLGYSPYHQLKQQKSYPHVFFYTSIADDRVHPAHARKMAAKMSEMGYALYYHETLEGGHSAGAHLTQIAEELAYIYTYATQQLFNN